MLAQTKFTVLRFNPKVFSAAANIGNKRTSVDYSGAAILPLRSGLGFF
jgi:hypothetical protein